MSTSGRSSTPRPGTIPALDPEQAEADVARFVDLLLHAARTSPCTVVLTARADFYADLLRHGPLAAAVPPGLVNLGPLGGADLARAIREPATAVGLTVDGPLVETLLDAVAEDSGKLPLLEYALKETWQHSRKREPRDTRLSLDDYGAAGGIDGAIAQRADELYAAPRRGRPGRRAAPVRQPGHPRRGPRGHARPRGPARRSGHGRRGPHLQRRRGPPPGDRRPCRAGRGRRRAAGRDQPRDADPRMAAAQGLGRGQPRDAAPPRAGARLAGRLGAARPRPLPAPAARPGARGGPQAARGPWRRPDRRGPPLRRGLAGRRRGAAAATRRRQGRGRAGNASWPPPSASPRSSASARGSPVALSLVALLLAGLAGWQWREAGRQANWPRQAAIAQTERDRATAQARRAEAEALRAQTEQSEQNST